MFVEKFRCTKWNLLKFCTVIREVRSANGIHNNATIWSGNTDAIFILLRAQTHTALTEWCVCACVCERKKDGKPIFERLKGGCVWPHLYFDAIGRALVAKASKGPRWKCIQSAHEHTHTHTLTLSTLIFVRASILIRNFYDVQLVSFALFFFQCTMLCTVFVCQREFCFCVVFSHCFCLCHCFTFSCYFCLYNMINVDVYIAVRSKRKYIEKWFYVYILYILRCRKRWRSENRERFHIFPRFGEKETERESVCEVNEEES